MVFTGLIKCQLVSGTYRKTYERAMDGIVTTVWSQFVMFYLENIFVFSESLADHIEQVSRVNTVTVQISSND